MKQYDLNTFNKLEDYNNLCNLVTFYPLQSNPNTNKFTTNINDILEKECLIYEHLSKMTTNANTLFIMESRHTQLTQRFVCHRGHIAL